MSLPESFKQVGDAVSASTLVTVLVGWLPTVAAVLTVVWTCMRIYNEVLEARLKHRKLNDE